MTLDEKISLAKDLFKDYNLDFEFFYSKQDSYRNRAEFSIFHKDDEIFYAMFDKKEKYIIKDFALADEKIRDLMPLLLAKLNEKQKLRQRLFAVEFLSTKHDLSATLLYHKNIEEIKKELDELSRELDLKLIARSKGKKLVFKDEILRQSLNINSKTFHYIYNNDCFVQANTDINEKMISYVKNKLEKEKRKDLLELYCGYGNFTIPLASLFDKILAVELSKKNIEFALKNCELNGIKNINFARVSSEELYKALKKEREFFRLRAVNLDNFCFSHILVDPPRAGLSKEVIELVRSYENIVYVSCNPLSLIKNLQELKEYKVKNLAFFDQFASTKHLECVAFLRKD